MLNLFLTTIQRKYAVATYLYCSEAQKNGNIHFHILINKPIHHKVIRDLWNSIQEKYGYIEDFYIKHGHRDPNSTDIHSLKKVNYIDRYIVKYFTKDENRRPIEGRLFGRSDNLNNLLAYTFTANYKESQELLKIQEINSNRSYYNDWFNIVKIGSLTELLKIAPTITKSIIKHYLSEFNKLYKSL
jgi:hypothetical protein